jgi:hypothetical protein
MSDLLSKYQEVVQTPPSAGDILTTIDGTPVVLNIQIESGKPPFIYGRAYFSETLDDTLGWYLRGADDSRSQGWRCVLMTNARKDALTKCKVENDQILVTSLKVIKKSASGNSLLCEVGAYLPEEKPASVEPVKAEKTITIVEPVKPDEDAF